MAGGRGKSALRQMRQSLIGAEQSTRLVLVHFLSFRSIGVVEVWSA